MSEVPAATEEEEATTEAPPISTRAAASAAASETAQNDNTEKPLIPLVPEISIQLPKNIEVIIQNTVLSALQQGEIVIEKNDDGTVRSMTITTQQRVLTVTHEENTVSVKTTPTVENNIWRSLGSSAVGEKGRTSIPAKIRHQNPEFIFYNNEAESPTLPTIIISIKRISRPKNYGGPYLVKEDVDKMGRALIAKPYRPDKLTELHWHQRGNVFLAYKDPAICPQEEDLKAILG